jgi:hypothetical protein
VKCDRFADSHWPGQVGVIEHRESEKRAWDLCHIRPLRVEMRPTRPRSRNMQSIPTTNVPNIDPFSLKALLISGTEGMLVAREAGRELTGVDEGENIVCVSLTGHTVVYRSMTSVMTMTCCHLVGQLTKVAAHVTWRH